MGIKITLPEFSIDSTPSLVKNRKEYERPGVYVFYDRDYTPLYVGKTSNFKRRFSHHARTSDFYHISDNVRLYPVDNEYEKDIYETHLINELKPQYNRAKSFYTRLEYEDMLHNIEEKISDIKYEIESAENLLTELRDSESEVLYDDFDTYEETEFLGESLLLERQITELEQQLRKLYLRKGDIKARISA